MLSTPFTCVSIGAATACATVAASAPGKLAVTLTVGGAIGGYCSTGSPTRAATPASVTTIDRTLAKIGRRMQKSEITGRAPGQSLAAGFWPAAACAAAASSGD